MYLSVIKQKIAFETYRPALNDILKAISLSFQCEGFTL